MSDTIITLNVDTVGVATDSGSPGFNIDNYVIFSDSNSDVESSGDPADYVTSVDKGAEVTWIGAVQDITNNPQDYVIVTAITKKPGANNKDILTGNGTGTTHVDGMAKGSFVSGQEEYTVSFTMVHVTNDQAPGLAWTGTIDPKLQMNQ